ncbi:FTR1 family iron permease [Aneurinibacillus sp. Ricciae_BoGa-3]|uniref:FTR1 family iron permease n=1 Tax=Aneurinibacillus sp. Ricciae_BoGa-3 TaxID=3022697 RepID=UPI002341420A|nr:FTR1 family protein [Aneurinibacillus sp. Ricciae_BoGa-3]WCK53283.1 FTR1 family iron permease [Aneurinibacillus sp. Ricciae_BoGa-3]
MLRKINYPAVIVLLLLLIGVHSDSIWAATQGTENMSKIDTYVQQALANAKQGKLNEAQQSFQKYNDSWLKIEGSVKSDSSQAYSDIESNMGQVQYAFMQNKQQDVVKSLQGLQSVNEKYMYGQYTTGEGFKKQNISLSDFIGMLQKTKADIQSQDQQSSLTDITKVRESWLSVEGTVVAQSATVYNDTERDMVTVNAMIASRNYSGASLLVDKMVGYLTPLASKTSYTIWDAAMIPIREGLEALLVVGALLAFVKKSNNGKGKGWIWSGVLVGVLCSAIIAVIVKFVFSSGAFGQNNFLISGWTAVVAAAMLLYMSYWLHSKANIAEWNQYIRNKSQAALNTGRIVSLGLLTFLAVFREGTETVLFVIGMVNQISLQQLFLGILIGIGILAIIAYLMLVVGVKLPMRPFFLVSSLIVFYLCFKFTGLGIHSFQLAGSLPSSTASSLPSIDFLGFYPSWQSALPQIALLLFALGVLIWNRSNKQQKQIEQTTN